MNFRPKQYYVPVEPVPVAPKEEQGINVYFRKESGELGQLTVGSTTSHKEAILSVQEALVADGDGLENKAVLAVINGGKNE